jgi:prepilin-type N-terminal cleavage/methylation domain-containing protein
MKTIKKSGRNKKYGMRNENGAASAAGSIRNSQFAIRNFPAFTLIELLVVISIIALLAAFTIPVYHTVARKKILDRTRGEMEQVATAIDSYKTAYGFYPPSNNSNLKYDQANPATWDNAMYTPLYFELLGTTNNNGTYFTLDGSASILVSALAATATSPLGVSGFINCSKSGGGEDAPAARNFLPGLTPKRIGLGITNNIDPAHPVALLLAAVGGPDPSYQPLGPGLNPWRYVSPGINNPNSYDLWVQLVISGRTNLICNWSKNVQLNSPLP